MIGLGSDNNTFPKKVSLTQLTIPDKFRNSNRDIEERGGAPAQEACGTSISKRQMRRPSSSVLAGLGGRTKLEDPDIVFPNSEILS